MLKELSLVTEPTRRSELIREISEIAENLGNDAELQSPQQKALACQNLANKNVNMNDMKPSLISATTTIDRLKSEDKPQNDISDEKKQPNRLIEKEQVFTGQVKFGVYLSYLKSIGWVACLLFFIVSLIASKFDYFTVSTRIFSLQVRWVLGLTSGWRIGLTILKRLFRIIFCKLTINP